MVKEMIFLPDTDEPVLTGSFTRKWQPFSLFFKVIAVCFLYMCAYLVPKAGTRFFLVSNLFQIALTKRIL